VTGAVGVVIVVIAQVNAIAEWIICPVEVTEGIATAEFKVAK
jgi:hypothetical protein